MSNATRGHRLLGTRLRLTLLLVLTLALGGSAIAWAYIPSASGVISGCYVVDGTGQGRLRVIDAEANEACKTTEKQLDWYSTEGSDRHYFDKFLVQREKAGTGFDLNGGSCGPNEDCYLRTDPCTDGKAVSGGYRSVDNGTHVSASLPAEFGYAWEIRFKNNDTVDTLTVVVTCDE
jgi:hypothetical protein